MSGYGRINLLGMLLMPAIATLTGVIMFGPRIDTMAAVFGMNALPMLIGGLFSGFLLRDAGKSGGAGRSIALWPILLTSGVGIVWYLRNVLFPAEQDPGRVFLSAPPYLLAIALLTGLCASLGCAIIRSQRSAT